MKSFIFFLILYFCIICSSLSQTNNDKQLSFTCIKSSFPLIGIELKIEKDENKRLNYIKYNATINDKIETFFYHFEDGSLVIKKMSDNKVLYEGAWKCIDQNSYKIIGFDKEIKDNVLQYDSKTDKMWSSLNQNLVNAKLPITENEWTGEKFKPTQIYKFFYDNKEDLIGKAVSYKQEFGVDPYKQLENNKEPIKNENVGNNLSPLSQAINLLTPSDRIFYNRIINEMNADPKGIIGNKCGIGIAECKWCAEKFNYEKVWESRINNLKMLNNPIIGGYANIILVLANIFSQTISSNGSNFTLQLKNEISKEINQIRTGNIYTCAGNPPQFHSLKCEAQYNYYKGN